MAHVRVSPGSCHHAAMHGAESGLHSDRGRHGYLKLLCGAEDDWERRFFRLHDHHLLSYHSVIAASDHELLHSIDLSQARDVRLGNMSSTLLLICLANGTVMRLKAESAADARTWLNVLQQRKCTALELPKDLSEEPAKGPEQAKGRAEVETEAKRTAEEEEAKHRAEAEADAKRKAEEEETRHKAKVEAEAERKVAEAEAKGKSEEEEAKRKALQAEAKRKAEEAEAERKAEGDAQRLRTPSVVPAAERHTVVS